MRAIAIIIALLMMPGLAAAQQPNIIQEHWYHSWTTLSYDTAQWAADYPEIVDRVSAGETELGRDLWVVRISDWSVDNKSDGTPKEIVYIDGGHHGNEHLGTELAFLVAEHYIEGWAAGDEKVIEVLQNTELHILIMLNADGNDINTRWNINQVDLNRNYDHHWNEQDETQPGSGPFSEAETLANSIYMNEVVRDADLYITMHTGVWIMLYPWGYIPDQPVDWELFHFIRDDVHANISDIPIRNANQGLYPNSGTSRDYGYGIMGFPTFTFETDDEQFLPGTAEPLSERLGEELDVMNYLIENIWYWRARLVVDSISIANGDVSFEVSNLGRATTRNATLQYVSPEGEVLWQSENFAVNATNSTALENSGFSKSEGKFQLHYQKRIIESSIFVTEPVDIEYSYMETEEVGFLAYGLLDVFSSAIIILLAALLVDRRERWVA